MTEYTLYAYVEGSDLHYVADYLSTKFKVFIESRAWASQKVFFVNQVRELEENADSEFLPDWELGLNLDLPERALRNSKWFEDVQAVVSFLGALHQETGRNFVIGIGDKETGFGEDYMFIDSTNPNAEDLRSMLE